MLKHAFMRALRGSDAERARAFNAADAARMAHDPDDNAFRSAAASSQRPTGERLVLGTLASERSWVSQPHTAFDGYTTWVTGATGAGKSALLLALAEQALPGLGKTRTLIFGEGKGEATTWLVEYVLPIFAMRLPAAERETFLCRLALIRPSDASGGALPPLNLLAAAPGQSVELLAQAVAGAIARMLGPNASIGARMDNDLKHILMALIEVDFGLEQARDVITDDAARIAVAQRVRSPFLREWLLHRLPKEPQASRWALASRLDLVLQTEEMRLALAASSMVTFDTLVDEPCVIIIDLSGSPEPLARLWGSVLFESLMRALMARKLSERSPPVTCIIDEVHRFVGEAQVSLLDLAITQLRWRKVGLVLAHQSPSQLSPDLLATLRTNAAHELHGRCDPDAAKHLAHVLPLTGRRRRVVRPWEDPPSNMLLSPAEERQTLMAELAHLPPRHFWWYSRHAAWGPKLIQSPFVDFDGMRLAAERVPAEIRERCRRGALAVPVTELRRLANERAERLRAWCGYGAAADGQETAPTSSRTTPTPSRTTPSSSTASPPTSPPSTRLFPELG